MICIHLASDRVGRNWSIKSNVLNLFIILCQYFLWFYGCVIFEATQKTPTLNYQRKYTDQASFKKSIKYIPKYETGREIVRKHK